MSLLPQISHLDNFDDKEEGEGKSREDKNQSAESEQVRKESGSWFGEDMYNIESESGKENKKAIWKAEGK